MSNLTIWQRLNFAMGLLILLLLIGGALAMWMERTNARYNLTAAALDNARNRVAGELSQLTAISRLVLLDLGTPEERKAQREACEANFSRSVEQVRSVCQDYPAVLSVLKRANELTGGIDKFNAELMSRAAASLSDAKEYYTTNYPALRLKQDAFLQDLGNAISTVTEQESKRATFASKMALVGIFAVLIAALVVGRFQSRSVTVPMETIVKALERMQRGDFTSRLQMARRDEFGTVSTSLNKLADELSVLVGQVQRSGIQVNSTATEIAATAKEQQSTVNEIAATTAEIGATSKEISATSKELVKTMNEVSTVSEDTAELAGSGQSAIGKMESTMRQIMEASGSITSKLAVLNEKTANINTVVTTITKVADQTNLLSLNAAIEAEKAGEYGLGFAVVAMEIRRLADQTAVATYDIEKMVKEMQSAVAAGVMGMDKFSEEVRRGVEEVRQVGGQLAQIIHQVQTLTPRFHTVNEGMNAQATGAQQISETLTQLNEAAQLTAESLRQSNTAIEQLNEAAQGLQAGVTRFKLKGNGS